ncbi:unnamed protein product [Urochloa decumbens]|uniref:DUF4220 domain-containing protein n=1 Tax=Urochloa decumbens TaxID=240449 RepID=A0ABC9CE68_9POAL
MNRLLVDLRDQWAVQTLVLFSFTLQVFLLLFASIRRYNVSILPRFFLWLAYQLADSTALFTLGHMAISSRSHEEQALMALWAPFLLVHLGGQDTITAYSFEDNRLWLRHLQTLVVQVLGSSYVLYKYMPGSDTLVMAAAVLIFAVGILKYGERIWALQSASFDSIWSSFDKSDASVRERERNRILCDVLERRYNLDEETVLMGAHGLLDVCVGLFIGLERRKRDCVREVMHTFNEYGHLDKLMEMELSLMYDILYTKAPVIHTWYGCCIRFTTLVATVTAFLMFLFSSKHDHRPKDIAVTYVLSVGALLLELASTVRAFGSTWTCAILYNSGWHWLHWEVRSFRRSIGAATTRNRRWSGFVCQYNLLESCAEDAARVPTLIWMAQFLGQGLRQIAENWWDELHHSWSAKLSDSTKELVLREIFRMEKRGEEIGSLPGLLTLKELCPDDYVGWSIQDIGFEDSIMAWHLASDICLFRDRSVQEDLQEAIRVLSNYMMFLLVLRPHMLPGPVRRSRYVKFHKDLLKFMASVRSPSANSPEGRLEWSLRKGFHARINSNVPHAYFDTGVRLADVLYDRPNRLDVIFGVWVEMLCYVANHCSRESHARQLSMGGELVTVVWLMARHANLSFSV